jgi:DNA-binding NtrC family response regulator
MKDAKILFVDDEPGIRTTLPAILTQFGFNITAAATVPEALNLIATQQFDVLISDLNIGEPGDGFTVVSAMRRTQPEAITFILTGYPAFETALQAIRQQVDDYLVKPADIETLVRNIQEKLETPRSGLHRIEVKRLSELLGENKARIIHRWLAAAKEDRQITAVPLSETELTDHLPAILDEIVNSTNQDKLSEGALQAAARHGKARFKQGCTIPMIIREARILQEILSRFVQENLLGADTSSVIPDLIRIGETLQAFLEESIREYVHARHAALERISREQARSVLLLSGDRELSLLRAHALEHAGFVVTRADSRTEALRLLEEKFDALLISYSLPNESITEMTELFRQNNPNSAIITVAKGRWQDLKVDVDFAVTGEDGPAALIEAVEAALSRKQLRRIK